jgi:hypothetical protein
MLETEVKEELETEAKVEKTEQEKTWDKERQRADQAEANFRKVSMEFDDLKSAHESTVSEIEAMREKIEKLTESKLEEGDEFEFDADLVDPKLAKTVKNLAVNYRQAQKELAEQKKKIALFEQKEIQSAAKARKDEIEERICSVVEDDFSSKYRNAARKLADELVDSGKESQPKTEADAIRLLKKCYKQVQSDDTSKSGRKPTPTDTGSRGVRLGDGEIKSGSRAAILEDMRKSGAFKGSL